MAGSMGRPAHGRETRRAGIARHSRHDVGHFPGDDPALPVTTRGKDLAGFARAGTENAKTRLMRVVPIAGGAGIDLQRHR